MNQLGAIASPKYNALASVHGSHIQNILVLIDIDDEHSHIYDLPA